MSPSFDLAKARQEFASQRSGAARRGIGWELTFDQWLDIWAESGHYAKRGPTGYVMARKWDDGPYAIGNVEIQTAQENHSTRSMLCRFREVNMPVRALRGTNPDPLELMIDEEDERAA